MSVIFCNTVASLVFFFYKTRINDENIILILGKPVLNHSLRYLTISCLRDYRNLFEEELEPIKLADLLFDERAVDILAHDKITETIFRRKQIKHLLETVEKNKEDCFHFFLFILQNEFKNICIELQSPKFAAVRGNMFNETCFVTYEAARAQGIK